MAKEYITGDGRLWKKEGNFFVDEKTGHGLKEHEVIRYAKGNHVDIQKVGDRLNNDNDKKFENIVKQRYE